MQLRVNAQMEIDKKLIFCILIISCIHIESTDLEGKKKTDHR